MKKKNLLVSAVAMLVVSALGLTAATYAWFTSSREPSIGQIAFDVTTTSSLQVSDKGVNSTFGEGEATGVDDKDWVDNLSSARLMSPAAHFVSPASSDIDMNAKLADSTPGSVGTDLGAPTTGFNTTDDTHYATMSFVKGTGVDEVTTKDVKGFITSNSYIRSTVYFRAEEKQYVFLNIDTSQFLHANGSQEGLEKAIRVAFVIHNPADNAIDNIVYYAPNGVSYSKTTDTGVAGSGSVGQGGVLTSIRAGGNNAAANASARNYKAHVNTSHTPFGGNGVSGGTLVDGASNKDIPFGGTGSTTIAWRMATSGNPETAVGGAITPPANGGFYTFDHDSNNSDPYNLLYLFDYATASPPSSEGNANDNIIAVTMFTWLEGFDDYCVNAYLGSDFTTAMSFYGIAYGITP